MVTVNKELDTLLKQLRLPTFRDNYVELATQAGREDLSYTEYLLHLARTEAEIRRYNQIARLIKASKLPLEKTFNNFDFT
jgi:DNA replication protein DnaC